MARNKKKKSMETGRRQLIAKFNPRSPISEQYRTIRTNIQFSSVDVEIRSIMVTSSGPGEGKSTTAANLAIVFAQQGKRVLLVDGDLRKPTVHYTFGLPNSFGLTNVLTRQMPLEEAIRASSEELLSVLTSGPIPPNPAELLGSRGMKEFMEAAQEQFDLIIFDTPPMLAVTDAQVLSNQCDGTIFIVSSGKTETDAAQKAKELLEAAKAKILGVIINNKKMEKHDHYYYYQSN